MRYVLLFLVFTAALVIVGCSGTTLFFTAFNSAREPWQQWLQGSGMAAIVAWEAGALLAIALCFRARYWATGIGAIVLLVLAMTVTSRQDLRLYVGGQADTLASRSVQVDDRNRVRAELERGYKRRDDLQKIAKLTKYQEAELSDVRARVADLEKRWDTRTENVRSSGAAEGELAHRLFGSDIDLSQALLDTLPLWFWMFARVFAIPAATVAMVALWGDRKRVQAPEAAKGVTVAIPHSSPVQPRIARAEITPRIDLSRKTVAETPKPDDNPMPPADAKPVEAVEPGSGGGAPVKIAGPVLVTEDWTPPAKAKPKTKAERYEAVDAITRGWLESGTAIRCAISVGSPTIAIYNSYSDYCAAHYIKPINRSHFGRSMKRMKIAVGKQVSGVRYGLRLVKQEQRRAAA